MATTAGPRFPAPDPTRPFAVQWMACQHRWPDLHLKPRVSVVYFDPTQRAEARERCAALAKAFGNVRADVVEEPRETHTGGDLPLEVCRGAGPGSC